MLLRTGFAVLAVAMASQASAQPAPGSDADLAAAIRPAAQRPGGLQSFTQAVQSPTAVDRRLGPSGATGSLGYLCGLETYANSREQARGPASSYGRSGTFLGAKLSLPFH